MEYKEKLIKAIHYHYPKAKIYLFGSRAAGNNKDASDIDLIVDIGERIDLYELCRMKRTVENLDLLVEVDLVDWYRTTLEFRNHVFQEMISWND